MLLNWRIIGVQIEFDCILIPLLASSFPLPILAILIRMLDLKGPVREWHRAVAWQRRAAFSGILYLTQDAICFALTGRNTLMFPISPILGAFFIVVTVFQIKALLAQSVRGLSLSGRHRGFAAASARVKTEKRSPECGVVCGVVALSIKGKERPRGALRRRQ